MNELLDKIKSMNRITITIISVFAIIIIVNLLGYGG